MRLHAVLSLNAVRASGQEQLFVVQPISLGPAKAAGHQPVVGDLGAAAARAAAGPGGPVVGGLAAPDARPQGLKLAPATLHPEEALSTRPRGMRLSAADCCVCLLR